MDFDYAGALLRIVLFPLGGAVFNGLFGRFVHKHIVSAVGVGTIAIAFLLTVASVVHLAGLGHDARVVAHLYDWFTLDVGTANVPIRVAFVLDALSAVMLLVVTGVGLLIHIYSLGYMAEDPGYARFFAYLNLFMASMLILVLGSSLPVMFVGWEGVGLCSYLLIGFWFKTTEYAAAGRKAFIANRIGDFGVLIATFLLITTVHTVEFSQLADRSGVLLAPFSMGTFTIGTVATVTCLFIFLGCTGKSAQIPLFVWLPDAMAGPTPVSALIHAATMVTAGVYLCCRMSALFVLSPTAMAVVAVTGALTALVAASIALVQNHMKRVLAYSTVSQLGFMFAAVGSGAFDAGIFHVFTHAFFKACLFLGAGAVMHAVHAHGDADIRLLGGLRKRLPAVHWTFLASCLAIAGVPLLSGWFSKDEILLGALRAAAMHGEAEGSALYTLYIGVFVVLVLAATMTAFYMFRLYFLTFWGDTYRSEQGKEAGAGAYAAHPHRPGPTMAWVLMALAGGAVVVGYLNMEPLGHLIHVELPNLWGTWLSASVAQMPAEVEASSLLAGGAGFLAMASGIGLAWFLYVKRGAMPRRESTGFHKVLMHKWYVDELYDHTVLWLVRWGAWLSGILDKYLVDGLLARASAASMQLAGWLVTRLQTGVVHVYGAAMVLGLAVITWWFMYPHPQLEGTADVEGVPASAMVVEWSAARGLGYEYRWDFDSDGEWETDFGPRSAGRFQYRSDHLWTPTVTIDGETVPLPRGEPVSVDPAVLGPAWHAPAVDMPTPPELFRAGRGVRLVRHDATVTRLGEGDGAEAQQVTEAEMHLEFGQRVRIGEAVIEAGARARLALIINPGEPGEDVIELDRDGASSVIDLEPAFAPRDDEAGQEGQEADRRPPSARIEHDRVVLRPNSATLDRPSADEELRLAIGESVRLDGTQIRVTAAVAATVDVRNAFGKVARDTVDVVLRVPGMPRQAAAVALPPQRGTP